MACSTRLYEFSIETKIAILTAFSGLLSAAHSRIYRVDNFREFAGNVLWLEARQRKSNQTRFGNRVIE
jgi:hypothetical protein